jgi:hypothetical protein
MSEPIAQQSSDSLKHIGHETTDASAFYVGLFALGLLLTIVLSLLLLHQMFWRFEASARRADPIVSPVAGNQIPSGPLLQTQPSANLVKLRHDEDTILGSYKWIDEQQGIVQVPIQRAIELLSDHGFPEPKAAEPTIPKHEAVR